MPLAVWRAAVLRVELEPPLPLLLVSLLVRQWPRLSVLPRLVLVRRPVVWPVWPYRLPLRQSRVPLPVRSPRLPLPPLPVVLAATVQLSWSPQLSAPRMLQQPARRLMRLLVEPSPRPLLAVTVPTALA